MSRIVFVLGAGASAHCGTSLMDNFLEVAQDLTLSSLWLTFFKSATKSRFGMDRFLTPICLVINLRKEFYVVFR